MPKIRFVLKSNRDRLVTDVVSRFILTGERATERNQSDLEPTSNRFTVNAAPGRYTLELEVDGFEDFGANVEVRSSSAPLTEVPIILTHKCTDLPEFVELDAMQQTLLATYSPGGQPVWKSLSDNQAATFFQVTHALLNTGLANGRSLSSYIDKIRVIGGVKIEDHVLFPEDTTKKRTQTGWRLHVVIRDADRAGIADALVADGAFGEQDPGQIHQTHRSFGLTKSHRQKGDLPRLQIVLSDDNKHADVDLDVVLHRSSPHDVFDDFIRKFPEVAGIYRF